MREADRRTIASREEIAASNREALIWRDVRAARRSASFDHFPEVEGRSRPVLISLMAAAMAEVERIDGEAGGE